MSNKPDPSNHSGLDRRTVLKGLGAGALGASALSGCAAEQGAPREPLDLNDPVSRFRARVKVFGSLAEETVHRVSRGHVWGYVHEGNLEPLFSMINYNVTRWRQAEEHKFVATMNETALFTRFDTDEVINHWDNIYTGETVEVQHYFTGPITVENTLEGTITDETATMKPKNMEWWTVGGRLFIPIRSQFRFPNPLRPEVWPKASVGPIFHWDSFMFLMAELADVENPELARAPAISHYQETLNWNHWMLMGQRPGRQLSRGYGCKLDSLEEMPANLRAVLEEHAPEMFDLENWTEVRDDMKEFIKNRTPATVEPEE
ncbi:MAG: DUF1838 family protein [Gammaproteobacteria bacterium]|nr:DUF1838 family protein [Gammaproteobacteria bacterium]MCY3988876.1 DUF1838 family protein [Gammaproteobacteria bacterium]